jgi:hypothetical protein
MLSSHSKFGGNYGFNLVKVPMKVQVSDKVAANIFQLQFDYHSY